MLKSIVIAATLVATPATPTPDRYEIAGRLLTTASAIGALINCATVSAATPDGSIYGGAARRTFEAMRQFFRPVTPDDKFAFMTSQASLKVFYDDTQAKVWTQFKWDGTEFKQEVLTLDGGTIPTQEVCQAALAYVTTMTAVGGILSTDHMPQVDANVQ